MSTCTVRAGDKLTAPCLVVPSLSSWLASQCSCHRGGLPWATLPAPELPSVLYPRCTAYDANQSILFCFLYTSRSVDQSWDDEQPRAAQRCGPSPLMRSPCRRAAAGPPHGPAPCLASMPMRSRGTGCCWQPQVCQQYQTACPRLLGSACMHGCLKSMCARGRWRVRLLWQAAAAALAGRAPEQAAAVAASARRSALSRAGSDEGGGRSSGRGGEGRPGDPGGPRGGIFP